MDENQVIESDLYGGKIHVKAVIGPTRHDYYVDGKRKTGVTTFIGIKDKSAPLTIWATETAQFALQDILASGRAICEEDVLEACALHKKRKEEAADLGTDIHGWIEQYILYKLKLGPAPLMPDNPAVEIGVNAWLDFVESKHKVKFLSTERIIYSKEHDYIGKMDVEAEVDDALTLLDVKSSNGLYNAVRMQTAAYQKADEEESGRKYEQRIAVRVAKETEEEYKARMERKRKIVYPAYQVFEAMTFGADSVDEDFEAFLAAKKLYEWDNKTDFWKVANKK